MGEIESKLAAIGLTVPPESTQPRAVSGIYAHVRIRGNRAYIAGHGPQAPDGSYADPFGQVGREVSLTEAREAARMAALSMLGGLKRTLGDLDRVTCSLRVFGLVNTAPGFDKQPAVINAFTELIVGLWGPARGMHARSAVGMAGLPGSIPVEIEAEVEIDPGA